MKHVAIIGGGDQANRRKLDFYPTPANCTVALLNFLHDKKIEFYSVVEPASGDGAISKVLEDYFYIVHSSDLRTENIYGSAGIDFLNSPIIPADALITNPPFNIAKEFIEKSVLHYDVVVMLLKAQYWHAKDRLSLFNKYRPSYVLPLCWRPDFLESLRAPGEKSSGSTMDVQWTVWVKGDHETKYQPLVRP